MDKKEKMENIRSIIQNLEMVKRDVENLRELDDNGCDELFNAMMAVPMRNREVWRQIRSKETLENGLRRAKEYIDWTISNLNLILKDNDRYSEEA